MHIQARSLLAMLRAICAALILTVPLAGCGDDDKPNGGGPSDTPDAGDEADIGDEPDAEDDASDDLPDATDDEPDADPDIDLGPVVEDPRVYGFANLCVAVSVKTPGSDAGTFLAATDDGAAFASTANDAGNAAHFFMKPSDLGTYLLYDQGEHYLVASDEGALVRQAELTSDVMARQEGFLPGAQWVLEGSVREPEFFQLRHLKTGLYLSATGLRARLQDAAIIALEDAEGCATHPELSLDATGAVTPRTFEDGSLYGIVETHSHLMSNFGFGGGSIFHGAPFHPLGVEHALPDCAPFHGEDGKRDLFGFGFSERGTGDLDPMTLVTALATGELTEPQHETAGYPDFTDWPNPSVYPTHQAQYYKWVERAYMAGLRLLVQHATTNQVICELLVGSGAQQTLYSCNDMVAVDRSIQATRQMERYIDAHHGGPGQGWFRVVESPAQAREVIAQGKMAVVMGLEVSNLFDCFLTPPEGMERCTEDDVRAALDRYHELGVRVMFPVHKYDNGFSAGDGAKAIMELANFVQTGHFNNFTQDCPDLPSIFDHGSLVFGGINQPREDYLAEAPHDFSGLGEDPLRALLPFFNELMPAAAEGDYCQNAGLTALGEFLIMEMMRRGMLIEIDHLPRRSYQRAFELLVEHDYPAIGSHSNTNNGLLYDLGGVSASGVGRCSSAARPGGRDAKRQARAARRAEAGYLPAEGVGFDLNGFAAQQNGRFDPDDPCPEPQTDPVVYPFLSHNGDVTFTEPRMGNRAVDYNAEGFIHLGMLPELIEDLQHDGVTEAQFEALFKSAEGYLQMWEKAEARASSIP